jgi:peptidyl-prolyl cis-trans isomerase SurA
MLPTGAVLLMAASALVQGAVVIDRIAIIAGNSIIKDSDIEREIRITGFLNHDPLQFSEATRKQAASRLIDQALLRREIQVAQHPYANDQDVNRFLEQIRKQRFKNDADYQQSLRDYGITEVQLRRALKWQLTVLRFINSRFRPGVLITDQDITQYFNEHSAEMTNRNGGKPLTLEEARPAIERQITGERVNRQFEEWLDETRKAANVQYREESLK